MTPQTRPQVRELDEGAIHSILARNYVGRIAFIANGRIEIRPILYVYSEGRIYGRTSPEAKLEVVGATGTPVAFEVDEVESMFRWQSVVAHGGLTVLSPEGAEREEWQHAIVLLRRLLKQTFTPADPVPDRSVIFRIVVQEINGREMRESQ